jgi:hypothetical protein
MSAIKQTWRVEIDEVKQEVRYFTRADDTLQQTFKADDLPEHIRNMLAIRGIKVTMEERCSSIPAAAIQSSMDGRTAVWETWCSGEWGKKRKGGGATVRIEIQAIADLKSVSVAAIRKQLKDNPELAQKLFSSEKVQAKVRELEAASREDVDLDDLL